MRRSKDLFDQVVSLENILWAAKRALRGKKDRIRAASFSFHLENEVVTLREELITGKYQPRSYHIFEIQDPKVRKICSSDLRDRVVHHAVCSVLEPIFERRLISDTYACRIGKGSHKALKRCQEFSKENPYFLKCDVRKFFETIDHEVLKDLLRRVIKDLKLLSLLDRIIDHSVPGSEIGKGLPIGNLTSQHFANLYLGELDHFLKNRLRVKAYLRYMDDSIAFGEKESLLDLLSEIRGFLLKELKLELKEKVTRIAPVSEGIPFLGMRIFRNLIRIQRPNLIRFRKKMKNLEADYLAGRVSETELICSMNSRIAHLSHANTFSLRKKEFEDSMDLA